MIKTLRLRLTLWHAGLFAALALVVFAIAYYMVSQQLLHAVDMDLRDTAQEFSERLRVGGIAVLQAEVDSETASHGANLFFARFLDGQGKIQVEHLSKVWGFPIPRPAPSGSRLQWFDVGIGMDSGPVRILALSVDHMGWMEIGLSLAAYESQMHQIRSVFALALLVMAVLGILAGWLQLRTVFRSVEQVRSTAIGISEGELDRRIELTEQGQELSDLSDAFNRMLDRIQSLLKEMRDVSDHIAHDLRTPVSRIRGLAETALMNSHQSRASQIETLATIVEEADQLGDMINTMLEIAQTDAGLIDQQFDSVDLAALLHEAHELFLPVAEDAGITLSIHLPDQLMPVTGSRTRLQRAISNLIDNALKFSLANSHVDLSAEMEGNTVLLQFRDEGIGIAAEDMPHIFERFYRSDQSRSKPGNGLGLSYAMSIIRSHSGDIEVKSEIGSGSTFTIKLLNKISTNKHNKSLLEK
jgi:signal transduction histidine kinase